MKYFFSFLLLFFYINSYALFCPTNFNLIQLGDTLAQVQQQCGKPTTQKTIKTSANTPQEWNYYVRPDPTTQSTLKMSVAFAQNKAVNISVNGTSIVSTPLCGPNINLGDSAQSIQASCGKPAFITQGPSGGPQETELTECTYAGASPVTLVFEDGKLIQVK